MNVVLFLVLDMLIEVAKFLLMLHLQRILQTGGVGTSEAEHVSFIATVATTLMSVYQDSGEILVAMAEGNYKEMI